MNHVVMALSMLIGYLILMEIIGLISYRVGKRTAEDYFAASRVLGTFVVLMTWAFTMWSTFTFYGAAGYFYKHGIATWSIAVGTGAVCILAATVGEKIWRFGKRYGYVTPADLLGDRYPSTPYHILVTIISIIFVLPYIGLQPVGVGLGLQVLTKGAIPYTYGAIMIAAFMVVYVYLGGIRAVAWTDVAQGIFVLVVLVGGVFWVAKVLMGSSFGGIADSFRVTAKQEPALMSYPGPYGFFTIQMVISYIILFSFGNVSQPQLWIRYYLPRTRRSFLYFAFLFAIMELVVWLWPVCWGMLGHVAYGGGLPTGQANVVTQKLVTDYLPFWWAALTVVGVAAASMSTADSQLVVCSALTSKDLYKTHIKKDASDSSMFTVGRIAVIVYIIAGLLIGIQQARAIMFIEFVTRLSWPGLIQIMPAAIGGMYWKRGTSAGALWGTAAGIAVVVLLSYGLKTNPLGFSPAMWGLLVNVILYVTISLKGKVPEEVVQRFFSE